MNTTKLSDISLPLSNDDIDNEIQKNRIGINSLIGDVKSIEDRVKAIEDSGGIPSNPNPPIEIQITASMETSLSSTTKNSVVILSGPTKDFLLIRYQ